MNTAPFSPGCGVVVTGLQLANLSEEEVIAGLPAEIASLLASANPENGQALSFRYGCVGCHNLDPDLQMTGPTWHNAGDIAANRQPGVSPAADT